MNNKIGRPMLLSIALILLLVACSDGSTPQATDEPAVAPTSAPQPTVVPESTNTPEPVATSEPTVVFDATAGAQPAVQTMEAILAPPQFVLGELSSYRAESSDLMFDYPSGWIITEEPVTGIRIESKAGIGESAAITNGASVVVIPLAASDLTGETSVEKLASFIIGYGTSPTAALGEPLTAMINGQELAFTSFVDREAEQEGVIAAFLAGDQLAVIYAVAGGESRVSYRPGVETIVTSIVFDQGE